MARCHLFHCHRDCEWRESAQPVKEQPASAAGAAALTGGGSDQAGKEELNCCRRLFKT